MAKFFKDSSRKTPEVFESPVTMKDANSVISIHDGEFTLKKSDMVIKANGKIEFVWFPFSGAIFEGNITLPEMGLLENNQGDQLFELVIDNLKFGECFITERIITNHSAIIKGFLTSPAIKGDRSIPVEKLWFAIPNMKDFWGLRIKIETDTNMHSTPGRLIFEEDEFIITIDKFLNYKDLKNILEAKGGYLIQYAGILTSKNGSILWDKMQDVIGCFATFLSFLNGRRTSPHFIFGLYQEDILWKDYTNYMVDPYKYVSTWPEKHGFTGLNGIWKRHRELWRDENDKSFLILAVNWYVEANSLSGLTDGSIIMAQTALELIYNWLLIEKMGIIKGKDAINISAANKIRLLLSQLNVDYKIPKACPNLQSFMEENKILDGPDAIVQIRNGIVHSQEEKRKMIMALDSNIKYEALQLSLWYIELSLLYIFGFEGKYTNRCSTARISSGAEEYVPWRKS